MNDRGLKENSLMQKLKAKPLNLSKIYFLVCILLMIVGILAEPISNLDELWKFDTSLAISRGAVFYKDTNTITTPLFFIVMSLFLRLSQTLICYRLGSCIFLIILYGLYYKLSNAEKDVRGLIFLSIFISMGSYYDYNMQLLLLCLLLKYIHNCVNTLRGKHYIFIGIICSLCILTKQTGGLYLCIAEMIILIRNRTSRKSVLLFFVGLVTPLCLFLLYLLYTNSFFNFFDYCLWGIISFKNNTQLIIGNGFNICVLLCLYSIIVLIKNSIKNKRLNLEDICYLVALILGVGVIIDTAHIYNVVMYLTLMTLRSNNESKGKKILPFKIICIYIIFLISLLFFRDMYSMLHSSYIGKGQKGTVYQGLLMEHAEDFLNLKNNHNSIESFYGKDVIMLSSQAVVINLYDKEYKGVFNLFLKGNLGTKLPIDYIKDLENQDIIVAISKSYKINGWQNPTDVYEYIQNNWQCISVFGNDIEYYIYNS